MQTMLTPEDSKRVADALIQKIEDSDFDVAYAVKDALLTIVRPPASDCFAAWKPDWFPLTVQGMCEDIVRAIAAAAETGERV